MSNSVSLVYYPDLIDRGLIKANFFRFSFQRAMARPSLNFIGTEASYQVMPKKEGDYWRSIDNVKPLSQPVFFKIIGSYSENQMIAGTDDGALLLEGEVFDALKNNFKFHPEMYSFKVCLYRNSKKVYSESPYVGWYGGATDAGLTTFKHRVCSDYDAPSPFKLLCLEKECSLLDEFDAFVCASGDILFSLELANELASYVDGLELDGVYKLA